MLNSKNNCIKNKLQHLNKSTTCLYKFLDEKIFQKFPLTPIGVLAPGSRHARPSAQPPIDMSGNFPAHVSAESPSKFSKKPKKN